MAYKKLANTQLNLIATGIPEIKNIETELLLSDLGDLSNLVETIKNKFLNK
jgi:hypothetical protein